ncbi:PDZ domain-containing protein [Streptomyces anandii]|uniref:PDZ domain-containing protein n=1 Tax=Streptomyces anandii TaxID=285454 RepID=UPI001989E468|nr:PDZ domain-containing protein [Streptomyces anandii]GGX82230.1 PDZ domain-containing protein [Streptomyces anandii JCM 4720]
MVERTALRPKPMPGRDPGGGAERGGARLPHPARRRGRRLLTALACVLAGLVLLLSGIGIGAVGTALIGTGQLARLERQMGFRGSGGDVWTPSSGPAGARAGAPAGVGSGSAAAPGDTRARVPAPVGPELGIEAVDDPEPGARVVGVHVPGPGYSAGLVRGDVILRFGATRTGSAAGLARAVARARPGREVTLTVRHRNGTQQRLPATPGITT